MDDAQKEKFAEVPEMNLAISALGLDDIESIFLNSAIKRLLPADLTDFSTTKI